MKKSDKPKRDFMTEVIGGGYLWFLGFCLVLKIIEPFLDAAGYM